MIVDPPAPLMVALDHRAGQQEAATYSAMPHVAWLEASIIDPAEYEKTAEPSPTSAVTSASSRAPAAR